jgi:hypothetical protein
MAASNGRLVPADNMMTHTLMPPAKAGCDCTVVVRDVLPADLAEDDRRLLLAEVRRRMMIMIMIMMMVLMMMRSA